MEFRESLAKTFLPVFPKNKNLELRSRTLSLAKLADKNLELRSRTLFLASLEIVLTSLLKTAPAKTIVTTTRSFQRRKIFPSLWGILSPQPPSYQKESFCQGKMKGRWSYDFAPVYDDIVDASKTCALKGFPSTLLSSSKTYSLGKDNKCPSDPDPSPDPSPGQA